MGSRPWIMRSLALGFFLVLTGLRFGDYFQDMGRVIEPYGDGYKAYTVIEYHAKNDSTYTHFEGMNYPYGDHAIPSATQPLLSNTIKFISRHLVDISSYTIAIVNASMLLSIVLCAFFLFLIFQALNLPFWYALLVAGGLTFLSPQILRMHAHYGLSHPEIIPILWYLLLRFEQKMKLGTSLAIGLFVTIYSLIHFYFFAILVFSISFYFLFKFLRSWNWKSLPGLALHYSLQAVLPLLFFVYWLFGKDPIEDRTPEPWGFFEFHAIWEGIVTSLDQPYFRWIDQNLIKIQSLGLENKSYIGLVAIATLIAILLNWGARHFKGPLIEEGGNKKGFLNTMFWASFALLLFAHGLPFTAPGLEFLLDYAGPIRQFRSVGRFAWLFYYTANILVFVWLYEKSKTHSWQWFLLVPALVILGLEAKNSSYSYNLAMDEVEEFKPGQQFLDYPGINYKAYQAILTVPYYNIGSDQFWWEPEGFILQKSLTLSTQTGLPVTSAMLTRSSRSQTLKQLQLATEPYRLPVILDDFPNQKPLLMILDQQEFDKERARYEHLLEGADLIYSEGDRLRMYRLALSSFEDRLNQKVKDLRRKIEQDTTLLWTGDFAVSDPGPRFFYDDLAEGGALDEVYYGAGAYQGQTGQANIFTVPNLPEQRVGEDYTVSIWMYIGDDRRTRAQVRWLEKNQAGDILQEKAEVAHHLIDLFDPNGWALVEMDFQAKATDSYFELSIENKRLKKQILYLDELLVRPKSQALYGKKPGVLWWNNRHYPLKD